MKRNGFTLMELIVTIAIMGLIGVVIGTNMLGLFSNEEDKEYESFIKKIEEAACIYVETANEENDSFDRSYCRKNGCEITIDKLIEKGLIDEDLKDPSTGDGVKNNPNKYIVRVNWPNDIKTCTMK